jgi:hypothetical protein
MCITVILGAETDCFCDMATQTIDGIKNRLVNFSTAYNPSKTKKVTVSKKKYDRSAQIFRCAKRKQGCNFDGRSMRNSWDAHREFTKANLSKKCNIY